mmetsp:Transcript_19826/g.51912  ORF Transcript_19826/g.51912 Transcript_19826/m.51912 type:complete len:285 (-) Transcript_19826:405-1259(-)
MARATEGREGRTSRHELVEDLVRVGQLFARSTDHGTRRHRQRLACVLLDFAALVDARGAVQNERKGLVGRHPEHERVSPHHGLDAVRGGDRGPRVRASDADAALLLGHQGVVAREAIVGRVAHRDHTDPVLLGLVDRQLHALGPDRQPQPQPTIDHRSSRGLLQDRHVRLRVQNPNVEPVAVYRLEPADAVRVDPALVRGDEHVGAERGVGLGAAVLEEGIFDERLEVVVVDHAGALRLRLEHVVFDLIFLQHWILGRVDVFRVLGQDGRLIFEADRGTVELRL